MNNPIIKLSLLFLFYSSAIHAQIQKGNLIEGQVIDTEIKPIEKHQYSIKLEQNHFAFIRLKQKGIDLKITTYSSSGEKIEEFDSPNGKNGFELFTLTSTTKGDYKFEIAPFNKNEPTGSYELAIDKINPKAILPNDQVDEIFAPWDNNSTPGAAISIVKDGEIVYKKGYGLANLEYDVPITPTSIFHIASISKQFTVFSILLLEKQGKLSLEDDIRKHIPEVPDFGKTITLRHLATHTSGLRDQWNLLSMAGWRMDDVITKEHVLKLVSNQKELNFDPGEEYTYCNTGFTLLAEVVARVSEMSFADFTSQYIFEPLNMKNTLFYDDHEKIVKNRAYSYYTSNNGFKKSVLNYANVGATSLFTTVEDLSLWSMNFANPVIGDSNIINKMNTTAVLNNGEKFGGALGQFVGTYKGLSEIQHGGADAGYRSYLTRFPDENFSVIVFSNSADFNPGNIAHKVVDIYLKDKISVKPVMPKPKTEVAAETIEVEHSERTTYIGDFELSPGFVIKITQDDGQLFAQATGQPIATLTPLSITEYSVEGVDAKIEFIPNDGNSIAVLKLHQGGQVMEAPRAKVFDLKSIQLSDFAGSFYSEELATTYHFTVINEKLVAKHSRLSDINLNLVKNDLFYSEAWFLGQIKFIRNAANVISGCRVTNGRVRNLYFEKIN